MICVCSGLLRVVHYFSAGFPICLFNNKLKFLLWLNTFLCDLYVLFISCKIKGSSFQTVFILDAGIVVHFKLPWNKLHSKFRSFVSRRIRKGMHLQDKNGMWVLLKLHVWSTILADTRLIWFTVKRCVAFIYIGKTSNQAVPRKLPRLRQAAASDRFEITYLARWFYLKRTQS